MGAPKCSGLRWPLLVQGRDRQEWEPEEPGPRCSEETKLELNCDNDQDPAGGWRRQGRGRGRGPGTELREPLPGHSQDPQRDREAPSGQQGRSQRALPLRVRVRGAAGRLGLAAQDGPLAATQVGGRMGCTQKEQKPVPPWLEVMVTRGPPFSPGLAEALRTPGVAGQHLQRLP